MREDEIRAEKAALLLMLGKVLRHKDIYPADRQVLRIAYSRVKQHLMNEKEGT